MYKFQPIWLKDPELKDYIIKNPQNPNEAFCKVCEIPLKPKKSILIGHGNSASHFQVCTAKDFPVPAPEPATKSATATAVRNFNPEWSRDFAWLKSVPENPEKCICGVCPSAKPFRAHLGDIMRHQNTKLHKIAAL